MPEAQEERGHLKTLQCMDARVPRGPHLPPCLLTITCTRKSLFPAAGGQSGRRAVLPALGPSHLEGFL